MPHAVTDDGVRIYYECHGDSRRARPPLVLAYGIGGNVQSWDTNIDALSARHHVVLWEPRGHGASDSPPDPAKYSFRRWALDLRDMLDQLQVRRAYVGGLSLGGAIATRFTLLFPRRVAALVISNSASASGVPLSHDDLIMRAQSIKIVLEEGLDAMAEFAMRANRNTMERLALNPAMKDEIYAKYRALNPVGYANSLRALLAMDHITDRLSEIRVPTLLVGGDRDPSLEAMKLMQRSVAGSELLVLSGASHFGNRDQPAAWNSAVLDFLERVERSQRRGLAAARP